MLFYCIDIFFFLPLWFVADVEAAATAPFTKTIDIDITPYSLLTEIDPKSSTYIAPKRQLFVGNLLPLQFSRQTE